MQYLKMVPVKAMGSIEGIHLAGWMGGRGGDAAK